MQKENEVAAKKILPSRLVCAKITAAAFSGIGMWLSLVERCVRDAEVAGSNPVIPTIDSETGRGSRPVFVDGLIFVQWMSFDEARMLFHLACSFCTKLYFRDACAILAKLQFSVLWAFS